MSASEQHPELREVAGGILERFGLVLDDLDYSRMAIPERNEILDELRRREETLEMRAEERAYETSRGYRISLDWPAWTTGI